MNFSLKKFFHMIIFNGILFTLLVIGIQNSSKKTKVNLLFNETVELPISFIVGISFLTGSCIGSIASIIFQEKNIKS